MTVCFLNNLKTDLLLNTNMTGLSPWRRMKDTARITYLNQACCHFCMIYSMHLKARNCLISMR